MLIPVNDMPIVANPMAELDDNAILNGNSSPFTEWNNTLGEDMLAVLMAITLVIAAHIDPATKDIAIARPSFWKVLGLSSINAISKVITTTKIARNLYSVPRYLNDWSLSNEALSTMFFLPIAFEEIS